MGQEQGTINNDKIYEIFWPAGLRLRRTMYASGNERRYIQTNVDDFSCVTSITLRIQLSNRDVQANFM